MKAQKTKFDMTKKKLRTLYWCCVALCFLGALFAKIPAGASPGFLFGFLVLAPLCYGLILWALIVGIWFLFYRVFPPRPSIKKSVTMTTDKPVVPPPSLQKGNEPNSMKAVGSVLDETYPQQQSTKPPSIPNIQNKKTATKVIITISIVAAVVIAAGILNDQRRSTNSSSNDVAAFDPQHEAAVESYLQNLGMEKFTSQELGFSLMVPKQRNTVNMDLGKTFTGQINGHTITVIAKDLPPSDPQYNVDNVAALRAEFVRGLVSNKEISDVQIPRNVKDRNGHLGAEIVYTLTYGSTRYHEQSHAFKVGHRLCLVQIAAPEAQWNKQLVDSVLTTFAMQ
jgi:hypothetical protein